MLGFNLVKRLTVLQQERRRRADTHPTEPIPLEQLVQDVYASSPPATQKQMLVRLVDKVYETSPAPLQELGSDSKKPIHRSDAVVLVEQALHAGGGALARMTRLLAQSPSLAGSGAAKVLVGLLRRTPRRRAGDSSTVE